MHVHPSPTCVAILAPQAPTVSAHVSPASQTPTVSPRLQGPDAGPWYVPRNDDEKPPAWWTLMYRHDSLADKALLALWHSTQVNEIGTDGIAKNRFSTWDTEVHRLRCGASVRATMLAQNGKACLAAAETENSQECYSLAAVLYARAARLLPDTTLALQDTAHTLQGMAVEREENWFKAAACNHLAGEYDIANSILESQLLRLLVRPNDALAVDGLILLVQNQLKMPPHADKVRDILQLLCAAFVRFGEHRALRDEFCNFVDAHAGLLNSADDPSLRIRVCFLKAYCLVRRETSVAWTEARALFKSTAVELRCAIDANVRRKYSFFSLQVAQVSLDLYIRQVAHDTCRQLTDPLFLALSMPVHPQENKTLTAVASENEAKRSDMLDTFAEKLPKLGDTRAAIHNIWSGEPSSSQQLPAFMTALTDPKSTVAEPTDINTLSSSLAFLYAAESTALRQLQAANAAAHLPFGSMYWQRGIALIERDESADARPTVFGSRLLNALRYAPRETSDLCRLVVQIGRPAAVDGLRRWNELFLACRSDYDFRTEFMAHTARLLEQSTRDGVGRSNLAVIMARLFRSRLYFRSKVAEHTRAELDKLARAELNEAMVGMSCRNTSQASSDDEEMQMMACLAELVALRRDRRNRSASSVLAPCPAPPPPLPRTPEPQVQPSPNKRQRILASPAPAINPDMFLELSLA